MGQSSPILKVTVRGEHENAAVGYFKERGFTPTKIQNVDELVVLLFAPPPERVVEFALTLPTHLNPMMGIASENDPL